VAERSVDPVCGMMVDPDRAAGRVDHNGKTYFFCSRGCVAKFTAEPEQYPLANVSRCTRLSCRSAGSRSL
jgi:YHS domain-containing protein